LGLIYHIAHYHYPVINVLGIFRIMLTGCLIKNHVRNDMID